MDNEDVVLSYMSDNIFIGEKHKGTVRWLSMDASKMEGSHTRQDIQEGIDFVLR